MKRRIAPPALPSAAAWTGAALLAIPGSVLAHGGHGAAGASHWHATDVAGLLLAMGAAALVYWLSRGGK